MTVLDALKVYFESNNAVPNSDWWITETKNEIYYHFRNFGKKTSLLVMIGTQGYNKGYGIVTDSHVAEKSALLDFLCKDYGRLKRRENICPIKTNLMLEELFDHDRWTCTVRKN